MSDERLKILKMLEEGKITAEEAAGLIEAVEASLSSAGESAGNKAAFLRIRVWEHDEEKVKVNVPLALARTVLRAIPRSALQKINAQGVDIEQLLSGVMDNLKPGKLVEVHDGGDRVEIVLE